MVTQQDWTKREVAETWDASSEDHNPIRHEQLNLLMEAIRATVRSGHALVDLGYGSGKVEARLFGEVPGLSVIGVDRSDAMMEIAAKRLKAYEDRFRSIKWDLRDLSSLPIPSTDVGGVIAVQSLHHLTASEMKAAYRWIFDVLCPGGVFFLMDRVAVSPSVWPVYKSLWRLLDQDHGTDLERHEGIDQVDHHRRLHERGDMPAPLQSHFEWLRACGFDVSCLHVHTHRALLAAVKPHALGGTQ